MAYTFSDAETVEWEKIYKTLREQKFVRFLVIKLNGECQSEEFVSLEVILCVISTFGENLHEVWIEMICD